MKVLDYVLAAMIYFVFLIVIGLVLLVVGADLLVKGAARLALSFGVSSLVVGLTVVAFGTSAPEMSVSVMSAYNGQSEMAVGNIVGSNIFNVLFILGLAAMIAPLVISKQLVRLDVPVMIGASGLLYLICRDGVISRVDGMILFACGVAYTCWLIQMSRKASNQLPPRESEEKPGKKKGGNWMNLLLIAVGLVLLVLGSKYLVQGAIAIAKQFGISEAIIGLTIVAAGTSLPEVATSLMATIKGERDIAVGNVVGSNTFNIFSVAGLSACVAPSGLTVAQPILFFDIPFMVVVAVVCLPLFVTGLRLERWNGALFLFYYIAYTVYLILAAQQHDGLSTFSTMMFRFVAPLTAVMILVPLLLEWEKYRGRNGTES